MKYTTTLLIVVLFLGKISYAQKVTFDYNGNGARVLRFVDLPKPEPETSIADNQETVIRDDYVPKYINPVIDFWQIELYKQDIPKTVQNVYKAELQTAVTDIQESVIQDNYVKIYPNPVKDFLHIELYKQDVRKAVIVDLVGRIALTINNLSEINNVDLSNLPNGVYLLHLSDKTYKLLKK